MRFYPYISVLLYKHILTNWKPTFLKVCCLMYVLTWTEILSDGYRVLNWAFCQMFKILEFVFQVFVPQSVIILLFHGHDYCSMAKTAVNGPQTPCPSHMFSVSCRTRAPRAVALAPMLADDIREGDNLRSLSNNVCSESCRQ